mmetsp:Transcript_43960/g.64382  ORF Transcript_43960/g.64382 Transcript_43960/m.64382 type:complete len:340 (+) Transcript_43960:9-1028(+)
MPSKAKAMASILENELKLALVLFFCVSLLLSEKLLIVYSGPTSTECISMQRNMTVNYHQNFEYFLAYGLPRTPEDERLVDIIIVLTDETHKMYAEAISRIEYLHPSTKFVIRQNRCYDLESVRTGLRNAQLYDYDSFIIMNCGLMGPFLPYEQSDFWAFQFTNMLSERTKLVGLSINCDTSREFLKPHVQSMLWATDALGLRLILEQGCIYDCGIDGELPFVELLKLIERYEVGLSTVILAQDFDIKATNFAQSFILSNSTRFSIQDPFCNRNVWFPEQGIGFGHSSVPVGLGFWKTSAPIPSMNTGLYHAYNTSINYMMRHFPWSEPWQKHHIKPCRE